MILFLIVILEVVPGFVAFVDSTRWWMAEYEHHDYEGDGAAVFYGFIFGFLWPAWVVFRLAKRLNEDVPPYKRS